MFLAFVYMIFLSVSMYFCWLYEYYNAVYIICVVISTWIIFKRYLYRKLLNVNEMPLCIVNRKAIVVKTNSNFDNNIGIQTGLHLMEYINIINQDGCVMVMDVNGRTWKLLSFGMMNFTLVQFIAVHDDVYNWIYELPLPCFILDAAGEKIIAVNKFGMQYIDQEWHAVLFKNYLAKTRWKDWDNILSNIRSNDIDMEEMDIVWNKTNAMAVKLFIIKDEANDGFVIMLQNMGDIESIKNKAYTGQHLQMLGQLTASVSHDFNNLLSAISGFCYLLQEHLSADHEANSDVREIQNTTARAQEMIKQLLILSAEKGSSKSQFTLNDPGFVLQECIQMLNMLLGESVVLNCKLNVESYSEKTENLVHLTKTEIMQIVLNLLLNAKEANAKNIKLEITHETLLKTRNVKTGVLLPGQYLVINVIDDGDGIDSAHADKICNAFYTTKATGSGIGLNTVMRIVTVNNGGVDFISLYGHTTFKIFLPIVNHQATIEKTRSIVLVEDDDLVRDLTKRALIHNCYDVKDFCNGQEAWAYIQEGHDLDLVITDALMPQMNGLQLIEKIRLLDKNLSVIFMTGLNAEELLEYLPEKVLILNKPFKVKDLISMIENVIECNKD